MNECKIIQKFKNNESGAWSILYKRFSRLVGYTISRFVPVSSDVDELINDVFIKARDYCEGKKTFGEFKALLYTVARTLAIDHLKKLKLKTEELDSWIEAINNDEKYHLCQNKAEETELIYNEIAKQPRKRRKVYQLILEGYTIKEIAEELKISESTVHSHKQQVEKDLKDKFGGQSKNNHLPLVIVFILQILFQEWQKYF
jgi:RNA polymerase sigma-70 factor, ECF subfamily